MAEHLTPRERLLIQKFSDNPIDFFTGETRGWLEDFFKTSGFGGGGGSGSGGWVTGDYKVSAQPATHTDRTGTWYLCNGDAFPAEENELITLVGANAPDARGRALVMLGTHADVNLIGDNDGIGTVANRSPKHNTSILTQPTISSPSLTRTTDVALNDPQHNHGVQVYGNTGGANGYAAAHGWNQSPDSTLGNLASANSTGITISQQPTFALSTAPVASGGAYGPGGTLPIDTSSYIIPGNLFIHS